MQNKYSKQHSGSILVMFAITLMLLAIVSLSAYAEEGGNCGAELSWKLSGGTLTISGSGDMSDYRDSQLAPWYERAEEIKIIELSSKITSIGDFAFYGCTNLNSISIPASVKYIGDYAFAECKGIITVSLGKVETIGNNAFYECEALTAISFPSSLKGIGTKAFYRCGSIKAIIIPETVTNIGSSAFAYCTNLVRATVNSPIEVLPNWIFYGCTSLTDVSLAPSVIASSEYSFQECHNLNTIYTQSGNTDIAYQLDQSIMANNDIDGGLVSTYGMPESSITSSSKDSSFIQSIVTQTNSAIISVDKVTDSSGEKSTTSTIINASLSGSDGWNDLEEAYENTVGDKKSDSNEINAQISGNTVEKDILSKFAGKDVVLNITTNNGTVWKVDMSQASKDSFKGSYDLDVSLEKVDSDKVDIVSDTIYSTKFSSTTDFNSSVGIKVDNAYQLATLYQKSGGSYEALQTVVVDENGKAWFNLASIDEDTDYYIGINAEGVTTEDAVIPESLYSQYGIDEVSYLTDDQGTRYELTGRYSKWGITGKQFAIYVGVAVGLLVVIVTIVMNAINKMSKSRAKYMRYADESEDEPIDEEAMRLQIMKEMLEEQKAKGKDAGKKNK